MIMRNVSSFIGRVAAVVSFFSFASAQTSPTTTAGKKKLSAPASQASRPPNWADHLVKCESSLRQVVGNYRLSLDPRFGSASLFPGTDGSRGGVWLVIEGRGHFIEIKSGKMKNGDDLDRGYKIETLKGPAYVHLERQDLDARPKIISSSEPLDGVRYLTPKSRAVLTDALRTSLREHILKQIESIEQIDSRVRPPPAISKRSGVILEDEMDLVPKAAIDETTGQTHTSVPENFSGQKIAEGEKPKGSGSANGRKAPVRPYTKPFPPIPFYDEPPSTPLLHSISKSDSETQTWSTKAEDTDAPPQSPPDDLSDAYARTMARTGAVINHKRQTALEECRNSLAPILQEERDIQNAIDEKIRELNVPSPPQLPEKGEDASPDTTHERIKKLRKAI